MLPSLDLRTLQIVAAVAETGSMSQAAGRYGLTQSAVSQAVGRAEKITGVALLDRSRRPIVPTPAGRVLMGRVQDLGRDMEALAGALRAAAALPQRIDLRLGLVDSFAGTVGAHLVKELVDGAMALSLTVWSGLAFSHAEGLMRRAIDAAITCDPMDGLADVERHPLFREPYLLVVPKGRAEGLAEMTLPQILGRHRLVRHSDRSHVGQQVERHLHRLGLRQPRHFEFDTSDALIAMVATGMGVAITTPLCLLQGVGHLAGVEICRLPGPGFSRDLLLVTRRGDLPELAPDIATVARRIIRTQALPHLVAFAPWLRSELSDPFPVLSSLPRPGTSPHPPG
jgi:DNA-binding transcriptional LysR family regulator